jgi:hypothetical protein
MIKLDLLLRHDKDYYDTYAIITTAPAQGGRVIASPTKWELWCAASPFQGTSNCRGHQTEEGSAN